MIYLVTVVSNTAVKVYGILIITIAAEAVLYYTIPSTSYLCPLKYINILAYANTKDLFASYLNLNIFGKPVNYMAVFVGSAIVLLLILSILSVQSKGLLKAVQENSALQSSVFSKAGQQISFCKSATRSLSAARLC